ncbi:MAG: IPT/TIG domain-containing protein [Planctomycetes bacterium]|nr:IPT/TIG domain-containing protein [Planctomycetota bacterium]
MDGHRTAGTLALAALSFVVGAIWFVSRMDGEDGSGRSRAAGSSREGTAESARGADSGDESVDPTVAVARKPRRRAHVPTDEDRRRDAAREALADVVVQAAANPGAANVRAMVLPGAARVTPPDWVPATVKLAAMQRTAAVLGVDALPGLHPEGARYGSRSSVIERLGGGGSVRADESEIDPQADPKRHGLRTDIYDFLDGELVEVPDLTALPPSITRVDPVIDFTTDASFHLPFEPDTFGVLWRGFLVVTTPGDYEFTCGSDDGARLKLDGTTVLEHTWLRPYAETSGTIHLDAGRHAFELAFYENYGFASCRLFWEAAGVPRAIVPAEAFEPPDEIAAVDPPRITAVSPLHARLAEEVTIDGNGFSATPALNRVTFADVVAEILEAAPDRLVVRVPIGASTGSMVVQVGPISTRPVRFEIDTLVGLYGEYFQVGAEIDALPDMDTQAPYFVRLDGPLDFTDDDLWALPYEPDVFATKWTGYLYVADEDEYEITLGSDDGAFVAIDGTRVVDVPGLHPYEEGANVVALTQGFHPIELRFFENYGAARLSLFWRRRGDAARVAIPRGFLFAPDALSNRGEPTIATLAPATAVSGDEIVVHGSGFGTDARYVRVAFPGDVWVRPTFAADDLLRVRVPWGAGNGELRVHVGVRPSAATQFTLGEETGLRGDYFELSASEATSASELPALLAARTPVFTRVDKRFRFANRTDWALPFTAKDFAVRWSGTIATEITHSLTVAFQTESAGLLRIEGENVVADVEPHTLREAYGEGRLTPGEHAIELFTLHHGGDPRLHVFITPFGRMDHLEVPVGWLRPRAPKR